MLCWIPSHVSTRAMRAMTVQQTALSIPITNIKLPAHVNLYLAFLCSVWTNGRIYGTVASVVINSVSSMPLLELLNMSEICPTVILYFHSYRVWYFCLACESYGLQLTVKQGHPWKIFCSFFHLLWSILILLLILLLLLQYYYWFYQRNSFLQFAQLHCKRCTSYSNSVRLSVRLSVCLSVRPSVTRRYCVKTTARSTVQFAPLDSKMCLVL